MKKWLEPPTAVIPEDLRQTVGGHELVTQVLVQRGITTPEEATRFLDPDRYKPCSSLELPGMDLAASRLEEAIRHREPICVWGDFDVDGQTATTTLVSTLRDLEANVTFHIPVREYESHGVSLPVLREILSSGTRLVLTCDTGISAQEAVEYARSQGVDFIITDHHELPVILPEATAVVDSRMLPESHPMSTLPGVGVAYKVSEELYRRFGREGEAIKNVDLAALGIVANLAIQTGEARYLVQRGLQSLRKTGRPALKALFETAEINPAWLTEAHIGFELGPRLNALGRLSDANLSVEFFTTQDVNRAKVVAAILEGLNTRRQLLTNQVFQAALAQVENDPALLNDSVLVLGNPYWPAGVVGIVASHLVERFNRPVVLLVNPPDQVARGSARSIDGCDITAAISTQKDLLQTFGGHPMAAGLSLDSNRIPEFRIGLSNAIRQMGCVLQPVANLQLDGYLSLADLSLDRIDDFRRLAPFGPGNPNLVLAARNLIIKSHSKIGRNGEHLQIVVEDEQRVSQKVLWWQGAGWDLPEGHFDLAFTVQASDFRGVRDVQLAWIDARSLEKTAPVSLKAEKIEGLDFRNQAYPLAVLQQLTIEKEIQIWCEAEAESKLSKAGLHGVGRGALSPGNELVIWTTPPGRKELQAVLALVSPKIVYIFGVDPEAVEFNAFLKRLAGLVKYAMNNNHGEVNLPTLASATAQREAAVRKGLEWLACQGYISLIEEQDGCMKLTPGGEARTNSEWISGPLRVMLNETAAFRTFFHQVDKDWIVMGDQ